MHPAFSVLVFTVMSGAGYGLITLLVIAHLSGISQLQDKQILLTAALLSVVLITAGLLSATLHLANPKNAWRSLNRFRTSWLSREGVFALLFYPFAMAYLAGIWFQGSEVSDLVKAGGIFTAVTSMITLFCTSMIYASLKTIRQWNSALTPVNYIVLGLMSGSLLLFAIQVFFAGGVSDTLYQLALVLIILGAIAKLIYLFWIGKPEGSTIQTATGFTQASVRLLDQGHTSNSFLNNEFGYTIEANKLLILRALMLIMAFVLPLVLILVGAKWFIVAAALSSITGLLIERWLFFAEARHVVRLYHGERRT